MGIEVPKLVTADGVEVNIGMVLYDKTGAEHTVDEVRLYADSYGGSNANVALMKRHDKPPYLISPQKLSSEWFSEPLFNLWKTEQTRAEFRAEQIKLNNVVLVDLLFALRTIVEKHGHTLPGGVRDSAVAAIRKAERTGQ